MASNRGVKNALAKLKRGVEEKTTIKLHHALWMELDLLLEELGKTLKSIK